MSLSAQMEISTHPNPKAPQATGVSTEIAVRRREPWILALRVIPGFDTIQDDPRFIDLLRRIGVEP
jgi:hypothetical protein